MSLFDVIAADLDVIFSTDEFGVEASYQPAAGGDPVSVTAIFLFGGNLEESGPTMQASGIAYIRESEVAAPAYQDAITIDGETWRVQQKMSRAGGMWKLSILRDVRPTYKRG